MEKETAEATRITIYSGCPEKGDMVAFSRLVDRYRDRLMNVIGRMLASRGRGRGYRSRNIPSGLSASESFDFEDVFRPGFIPLL